MKRKLYWLWTEIPFALLKQSEFHIAVIPLRPRWQWGGKSVAKGKVERKPEGCGRQEVSVAWWSSCLQHRHGQKLAPAWLQKAEPLLSKGAWQQQGKKVFLGEAPGTAGQCIKMLGPTTATEPLCHSRVRWDQPRPLYLLIQGKRCRNTARWFCPASSVHTLSQAGGSFWGKDIINSAFQKFPATLRESELVFHRNFLLENVRGFFFLHRAAGSCMLCCHTWQEDEG